MSGNDRFQDLDFEAFKKMAGDNSLSKNEKIGFPESYRDGKEDIIFSDIKLKLPMLTKRRSVILDIGPGCGPLCERLVEHCREYEQKLILVDSQEMLEHIPDESFIEKVPAFYPECPDLFTRYAGKVDVLICYSVFHYVFVEAGYWRFLDKSLELLAMGGAFLLGDIPNVSKRKRFFSSDAGVMYHREFMGTNERPTVNHLNVEHDTIDDSVVLSALMRARMAGYDAYLLPQGEGLPMANRREDILIVRP